MLNYNPRYVSSPFSGGQIVLLQHLVSSLSVNGCTVRRLRAELCVKLVTETSLENTEFRQTMLLDFIVVHQLDVLLYAQYRFISPLRIFVLRNNALKLPFEDEE
jgi:hypothetical protein